MVDGPLVALVLLNMTVPMNSARARVVYLADQTFSIPNQRQILVVLFVFRTYM